MNGETAGQKLGGGQTDVATVSQEDQSKRVFNDQREKFQPIATKFRRRGYIFSGLIITGLLSLAVASFTDSKSSWFGAFFAICVLSALVIGFFLLPKLRCPTCSSDAANEPGFYCPECGGSHLSEPSFLFGRKCADCGKSLRNGRRRNYTIHYCQNCGAYLDESGL